MTKFGRVPTGAALLAALVLIAGCGSSPPTNFYALKPTPPESSGVAEVAPGAPILVDAVRIPPVLDRPEIVRATGSSRVTVSGHDRWAAPVGGMIRTVLAQNLRSRMPASAILSSEDVNGGAPKRDLVVDIQEFQADASDTVVLSADWGLLDNAARAARPHHERITVSGAGGDADSQVAAMSRALGELADRIVAAIAAPPRSTAARVAPRRP